MIKKLSDLSASQISYALSMGYTKTDIENLLQSLNKLFGERLDWLEETSEDFITRRLMCILNSGLENQVTCNDLFSAVLLVYCNESGDEDYSWPFTQEEITKNNTHTSKCSLCQLELRQFLSYQKNFDAAVSTGDLFAIMDSLK